MSENLIRIEDAAKHSGQDVSIKCWVYNKRSSGKIAFLQLRDGSPEIMQAVVHPNDCGQEAFEIAKELSQESSIEIFGQLNEHPKKPGVFELITKKLSVIHLAQNDYPISHKEHGPEHLMQHRHLWLRTPRQTAVMRVRASIIKSIRDFFDNRGFVLMDPPILTPSACEGTSTLFETDYFDGKAYLTQSGQLYAEAGAMALGKTYTFGPTFRAEKSKTRKHLTEFWMVEPEVAFMDLEQNMQLAEELIVSVFKDQLERCKTELEVLKRDTSKLEQVAKGGFPRISYNEMVKKLNDNGHPFTWGEDPGAPDEQKIGELFDNMPVFIHRFPKAIKSFYFKADDQDERCVLGCDLIAPEGFGEIIGGSQREDDYETLKTAIKEYGLPAEDYQWYLDLRKYGSCPHAGFGLGLERTVSWVCGLDHVRETIAFPRMINYIRP